MCNDPVVFQIRIPAYQCIDKRRQSFVLGSLEFSVVRPFQFYANGEIITGIPPLVAGCPGMPGAIMEGNELKNLTITTDQYMSRYLQTTDIPEIGMRIGIKAVGEKFLDLGSTEPAGREANAMNDDQVGHNPYGSRILIRRWYLAGLYQQPALGIDF